MPPQEHTRVVYRGNRSRRLYLPEFLISWLSPVLRRIDGAGERSQGLAMQGYFDHNATTPMVPAAQEAWREMTERFWHNPSGLYREGAAARQRLEDCREWVADRLGCEADRMVFLSGATEANNALVAWAADGGLPGIAASALEHPCLLEPAGHHFGERLRDIPIHADGTIDLAALGEDLREHRPGLVALMAANNETGVIQPWREAAGLCREAGVLFHCDAAQWIGKLPSSDLGICDFLTGSAHKFGGPKGVGFLKIPAQGRPFRWLRGGPQEEQRRAGTENLPGVAAMVAAWEAREESLATFASDRERDRKTFERRIQEKIPGVRIMAPDTPRLWNTVMAIVPPPSNVKWLSRLSSLGFAVSTGSACSRGAGASAVLQAMGVEDAELGQALRFSGGWETTGADWLALADALETVFAGRHDRLPGRSVPKSGAGFPGERVTEIS